MRKVFSRKSIDKKHKLRNQNETAVDEMLAYPLQLKGEVELGRPVPTCVVLSYHHHLQTDNNVIINTTCFHCCLDLATP